MYLIFSSNPSFNYNFDGFFVINLNFLQGNEKVVADLKFVLYQKGYFESEKA